MTRHCQTPTGSRAWTKEEMMVYLDWDKSEQIRLDAQVEAEFHQEGSVNSRRGIAEVWRRGQVDSEAQQDSYIN
jgi:hypothetical protein